jgi:hypothetical protein
VGLSAHGERLRVLSASPVGAATGPPSRRRGGWIDSVPVLCPFRRVTGLLCPGCGLTRATLHLLHGRVRTALDYHPLAPALLLAGIVALLRQTGARARLDRCAESANGCWQRMARRTRRRAVVLAALLWTGWVVSRWRTPKVGAL